MHRRTMYRFSLSYSNKLINNNPLGFTVESYLESWFDKLKCRLTKGYTKSHAIHFRGSWKYFELDQYKNNAFFN
ncbi:hypothetical protein, partial [Klebsiella pneumoniae]